MTNRGGWGALVGVFLLGACSDDGDGGASSSSGGAPSSSSGGTADGGSSSGGSSSGTSSGASGGSSSGGTCQGTALQSCTHTEQGTPVECLEVFGTALGNDEIIEACAEDENASRSEGPCSAAGRVGGCAVGSGTSVCYVAWFYDPEVDVAAGCAALGGTPLPP